MKWLSWFILAYVMIGVQAGIAPVTMRHQAPVNLVLIAVVFIALYAARSAALLGSVLMGLMQDILTTTPLGTYGFAYGMVALLIVSVQQVVHREHPVTHFSLSLIGSIMTGLVLMGVGWRHGSMPAVLALLVQSLLTAALSVPVVWLLMRFRKAFAFDGSRRRFG